MVSFRHRSSEIGIYGHPFASFYWKTLIALYERDVPFEFLMIDAEHPENAAAIGRLSPTGQFPVLIDGDRTVIESAAITLRFATIACVCSLVRPLQGSSTKRNLGESTSRSRNILRIGNS